MLHVLRGDVSVIRESQLLVSRSDFIEVCTFWFYLVLSSNLANAHILMALVAMDFGLVTLHLQKQLHHKPILDWT